MSLVLIVSLVVMLFGSLPIFIALNLAVFLCLIFFTGMTPMILVQKAFGGIDKFALMSMPFFIFAANVMDAGGLSDRILRWTKGLVGSMRGGLAYTTQVTCMIFGALCGSSPATVIAMGKILYPELIREGYPKRFAVGLITSAGSVALIIPPSITLIIYAAATGTSVGALFMAGISAGIIYGLGSLVYIYFFSKKHDLAVSKKCSLMEKWKYTKEAIWSLMVPVLILGGIYWGVFTPTEAAGVSVVYSLFVGIFVHREISLKKLYEVCLRSAVTCAQVLVLVAGAQTFGWFLTVARVPQIVSSIVISNVTSPIVLLAIMNLILLIVGMFMEGIAAIIILAPLFFPVAIKMGIDPVHLGIIMVANLSIGNFTPPFGLNLFVANGVTGLPMSEIIPAVGKFILVSIFTLFFITYVPPVSTFLPNLIYP